MAFSERWVLINAVRAEHDAGAWFDCGGGNMVQVARRMLAKGWLTSERVEVRRGRPTRLVMRECFRATDAGVLALKEATDKLAELRARRGDP